MVAKKPSKSPLAHLRPAPAYALEWEAVEDEPEEDEAPATDLLGLTPEDRAALGMSPPAVLEREERGDAAKALRQAFR